MDGQYIVVCNLNHPKLKDGLFLLLAPNCSERANRKRHGKDDLYEGAALNAVA
jgi:hypothetical protein